MNEQERGIAESFGEVLALKEIRIKQLEATIKNVYDLIADDAYAVTFQSLGQYRSALLKTIPEK